MKLVDEFKAFALKGNAVDMSVGIIIGAAFGKIVSEEVAPPSAPPAPSKEEILLTEICDLLKK